MNSSGIAGTVLAGYRAGDTVLLYTGALMSDSSVKANINQDLSADTLDAGGTYTYTDRVRRSGPVLGFLVSVNKRFSLQVEGTYLRSTFDQANVVLDNETSAAATARFDLGSSTKN